MIQNLAYPAQPSPEVSGTAALPRSALGSMRDPAGYLRDQQLADAVNVALTLMQPLLLTGAPGVGKSELAFSIAYELGLAAPKVFETKSTSKASDLFYTFDTLGRFAASQSGSLAPTANYITFNALGLAIVESMEPVSPILKKIMPQGFAHPGKRRSVVLIDEVEKAPRDMPNDLLNEIDRMYFRIQELENIAVEADQDLAPVVVITSNSESSLPDAFLRRCVYYHIPFPSKDVLQKIVLSRIGKSGDAQEMPAIADAVEVILGLQKHGSGLEKVPGTAELLNWLTAILGMGGSLERSLRDEPMARRTLTALSKLSQDQIVLAQEFEDWLTK